MNEYKNPETMKSVIDHIEEGGDAVFREVFRNRLWIPIVGSSLLVCVAVTYLFIIDEHLVNRVLDAGMALLLAIMTWGNRYSRAQTAASESKYAHAMSYLDEIEDEPDA